MYSKLAHSFSTVAVARFVEWNTAICWDVYILLRSLSTVLKRKDGLKIDSNFSSMVILLNFSKAKFLPYMRKGGKNVIFQGWLWAW